ncbi:hypothetical protein PPTG_23058 [Phytophthora nicotianae INRA-310]|uniref:Uncharacterized protein n=1 Tax=Phytophthora nicotianae (strain INRA-310) TaxID=761204 RepID=W2Q761_PHYN3|nr:hypothetical protein PPTG_23058 [Phytophthora nicotianae INRA-310]ETN08100.1 hypothetical protein PPTG_23058 [Phytophthora nicotianae INRA-310]
MAKMKTSTSAGSKQRSAKDASFAPVSNAARVFQVRRKK